ATDTKQSTITGTTVVLVSNTAGSAGALSVPSPVLTSPSAAPSTAIGSMQPETASSTTGGNRLAAMLAVVSDIADDEFGMSALDLFFALSGQEDQPGKGVGSLYRLCESIKTPDPMPLRIFAETAVKSSHGKELTALVSRSALRR